MKAASTTHNTEAAPLMTRAPADGRADQCLCSSSVWESPSPRSPPLTPGFNGGMQRSFKELHNFLNKSSGGHLKNLLGGSQYVYTAYSQPIRVGMFNQETE